MTGLVLSIIGAASTAPSKITRSAKKRRNCGRDSVST
jgi:hypothetical protein